MCWEGAQTAKVCNQVIRLGAFFSKRHLDIDCPTHVSAFGRSPSITLSRCSRSFTRPLSASTRAPCRASIGWSSTRAPEAPCRTPSPSAAPRSTWVATPLVRAFPRAYTRAARAHTRAHVYKRAHTRVAHTACTSTRPIVTPPRVAPFIIYCPLSRTQRPSSSPTARPP